MLYLCPTPIGNLEDITLRTLRVLREVECIYAEDTRQTLKLLNHYNIKKPIISCHEHNEASRAVEISERASSGAELAFVSDAGMPCVSDPGNRVVSECIKRGAPFTVLPGASACLVALALSGLPTNEFCFMGFLPRGGRERAEKLNALKNTAFTTILYENPSRVGGTLSELESELGGERRVCLARELTKLHENAVRGTLSELAQVYLEKPPRGECVLIIDKAAAETHHDISNIKEIIERLLSDGMKTGDIAREINKTFGIPRNEAYKLIMSI